MEKPRESSKTYFGVVAIEKRAFRLPSTTVGQLSYLHYIYTLHTIKLSIFTCEMIMYILTECEKQHYL